MPNFFLKKKSVIGGGARRNLTACQTLEMPKQTLLHLQQVTHWKHHHAARNSTFQQLKLRILLQMFVIGSPEWIKISFGILCPKTSYAQQHLYTLLNCSPSE